MLNNNHHQSLFPAWIASSNTKHKPGLLKLLWGALTGFSMVLMCFIIIPKYAYSETFNASGNFYLEYFGGRVNPSKLPEVYSVFEQLRNVSDKHANRWPELLIIRDLPGYQVLALPDGHIIISYAAIQLLYKDVPKEIANTRLAFMLGHELAHIAENDFWDSEMAQSLVGLPQSKQLGNLLGISKTRHNQIRKETKADDKGMLYAALAGYPVGLLFKESNQQDFLSNWVQMTAATDDGDIVVVY